MQGSGRPLWLPLPLRPLRLSKADCRFYTQVQKWFGLKTSAFLFKRNHVFKVLPSKFWCCELDLLSSVVVFLPSLCGMKEATLEAHDKYCRTGTRSSDPIQECPLIAQRERGFPLTPSSQPPLLCMSLRIFLITKQYSVTHTCLSVNEYFIVLLKLEPGVYFSGSWTVLFLLAPRTGRGEGRGPLFPLRRSMTCVCPAPVMKCAIYELSPWRQSCV